MDFESARKQFERLSRLFQNGEISSEDFTKGVDQLSITDSSGDEWMIGMRSGKWYRKVGADWVENDPSLGLEDVEQDEKKQQARRRKWIVFAAILILALFCIGSWNFGIPGVVPKRYDLGLLSGRGTEETEPASQSTSASLTVDVSALTPDSTAGTPEPTLTVTISENEGGDPTQTATATVVPSITMTPTPPSPIAAPENWELRSALNLDETFPLNQDWRKLPDKPWEYEFLPYEDREALLIQFMEPDVLWHAEGDELEDMERTITMAIPDEGAVSILCLWQLDDNSGYKIRLSSSIWQFVEVTKGNETVREEVSQPPEFDIGDYANFFLRCKDGQIGFWRDKEQLLDYRDAAYESGAAGLRFEINEGIGLAFITEDQVWAQLAENVAAGEGDLVRRADLDIWLVAVRDGYDDMVENGYERQALIGFEMRIVNKGVNPIQITPSNLILQGQNRDVFALDFIPQTASSRQLFPFGDLTGEAEGEVFFAGISPAGLENWTLVVDLRYQGYGEAIFELGD